MMQPEPTPNSSPKQSIQQQNTAKPVLIYPAIRGSVQPVRNLFYYLNVQFEESGLMTVGGGGNGGGAATGNVNGGASQEKITEAGFNSGFPRLVQGDVLITDVVAIFRHICRQYKRPDLLGLTPQTRGSINEFLFPHSDLQSKLIKKIFEGAKALHQFQTEGQNNTELNAYQLKLSNIKQIVQSDCVVVKNLLYQYMKNKGWIFGYFTIGDFFFYQICFYIVGFFKSVIVNHPIYRNFCSYLELFESQQFFQANKDKIMERKLFMPFKNAEKLEILKKYWEASKQIIA